MLGGAKSLHHASFLLGVDRLVNRFSRFSKERRFGGIEGGGVSAGEASELSRLPRPR
jgi:hypothetical protein